METTADIIPRNYQVELMRIALERNTIIYLPTGAGKTFIAVMVLKHMSGDLERSWSEGRKISVILVNTVALVHQHAEYLRRHTCLEVGSYSGEMNVDFWDHSVWEQQCSKYQIFVMTCQILTDAVEKTFLSLERINLMIFDECHRGVNDHAMRQLMKSFQYLRNPPRVLGLTATLLNGNCKPVDVLHLVGKLEVTYQSKVATVDELRDVVGFSTNPHEVIKSYMKHHASATDTTVLNFLRNFARILLEVKTEEACIPKVSLSPLEPNKGLKDMKNLIDDSIFHIESMGAFGGIISLVSHIIQFERLKRHCDNVKMIDIFNSIITALAYAKNLLQKQLTGDVSHDIFAFSTPKVIELFNVIQEYKSQSNEELCGIIFVQRRFTAKVLFHILKKICENVADYSFLKPNFMVGYNTNPLNDTRESLYYTKMNKGIIQSFYTKEINLLIASNVLEEGIDVPKCSFVCKYDVPLDYRSYIQSKGRARHQSSYYYIMLEQGEEYKKFITKYTTYQEIESHLNDYLVGKNETRSSPKLRDIEMMLTEDEIPPYYVNGPGSAQVNMVSAISLLSMYCNSLPSDIYTTYAPNWYLDTGDGLRVVIEMPVVCPILEPVKGPAMNSKKQAKRAAALKACTMLHKLGELDDNLIPIKRNELDENTNHLFVHWPETKVKVDGTNKKRRNYPIRIPTWCVGGFKPMLYSIHIIELIPNFSTSEMMEMYTSNLCFGFMTLHKLPPLCKFPLYVKSGEISVNLRVNVNYEYVNEGDITAIKEFNHLIYNDLLCILKEYLVFNNDEDAETILLVPCRKDNAAIDYDVMRDHKQLRNRTTEPNTEEKMSLKITQDDYLHKIVTPWYRDDVTEYLVIEVCDGMTALSAFPGDHDTYYDYFREMYQYRTVNTRQPLLKVKALSARRNCLKPRGMSAKKMKDYENFDIHFIPEMIIKQDFPAQLWVQAKLLPSILDKVMQLLRAEELRQTIAKETNLGRVNHPSEWKPLELDVHLLNYDTEFKPAKEVEDNEEIEQCELKDLVTIFNKLSNDVAVKMLNSEFPWRPEEEPVDIERNIDITLMEIQDYDNFMSKSVAQEVRLNINNMQDRGTLKITDGKKYVGKEVQLLDDKPFSKGPELAEIYQALATAKSGDIVNLERLETLGDSFLKFSISLYIVLKYPKYDEGKSSTLKGKLVSNRNLFYLANKKGFGGLVKFNDLKPTTEWRPPNYLLPKVLQNLIQSGKLSHSALLCLDIPVEEQIIGILSKETERSILMECLNNDQEFRSAESSFSYYLGSQNVPDKVVADVVESLLGVYLQSNGIKGAIKMLEWLEILPESENLFELLQGPSPNPILNDKATQGNIDYHIPTYKDLEKRLGYNFKNRAYLLQALTHSSYTPNRITKDYQRLEFLGDAVLDFLITCHIYESCGYLNPGDLTDLRSALVNNVTFACLTVRCGFHKFFLFFNTKLQGYIDKFLLFQKNKNYEINDDVLILLNEDDLHIAEYIDVPKVLGDIFEALAGAVYLDSGKDLKTVWQVFYRIMWKEIESFSNKVPKNAIRVLYETVGTHPMFHKAVELDDGRVMMKLDFMINGSKRRVHGFGDNKKVAKKAAAKIALRLLGS